MNRLWIGYSRYASIWKAFRDFYGFLDSWTPFSHGFQVSMWLNWFHRGRLAGEAIVTDMLFVSGDRFREVQLAAELDKIDTLW